MLKFVLGSMVLLLSWGSVSAQSNLVEAALTVFRSDNYSQAANLLTPLAKPESDGYVWMYLGASLLKLGKEQEAAQAFARSVAGGKSNEPLDKDLVVKKLKKAKYTAEAVSNAVEGNVNVAVEFRSDGTIGFAFPYKTLPYGLTENAVQAAKAIKFTPAVKNGKPITVVLPLTFSFDLGY
jgi:hypothetical protein